MDSFEDLITIAGPFFEAMHFEMHTTSRGSQTPPHGNSLLRLYSDELSSYQFLKSCKPSD